MAVAVKEHYTRCDLTEAIREALQQVGKDPAHLQPAELAAVDEFHIRGRQATLELASRIKPTPADRVLDIGSGLGGASRALAATYGCHVTGIDLTEEYCRTARELAEWVGLGDRVTYQQADALDLPFPDGSFDIAWTQHVAMNIPDKATLYRYAVWTGVGTVGTALLGMALFHEPADVTRLACVGLIVAGIIGLKLVTPH